MSAYFNNKNLESARELAEVNGKTLISGIEPVIDSAILWQKGPSVAFFLSTSLKAGCHWLHGTIFSPFHALVSLYHELVSSSLCLLVAWLRVQC